MKLRLLLANKAFSLIELSIYMAMLTILTTTLFVFLNQTQKNVIVQAKKNDQFIRSCLAIDLLKRDLSFCDPNVSCFDQKDFVFKKTILTRDSQKIIKNVSWQVWPKGLCRIEGVYDFAIRKWGKRVVSLVSPNIKAIKMEVALNENKSFVRAVNVLYKLENKFLEEKIFLQNRII